MTNKLMFPIYFYDGGNVPKDDICYLITKKGPMIKKKLGMVESLVPVKDISILEELQGYVRLHVPKIPEDFVASTLTFFRAIYNKHNSEAIVLVFYNEKTHEYIIEPPPQTGNSASLDYTKGTIHHDGFNLIGTIHSHGSMSAFHSGTDHADEANFDGIHITFGNVINDQFTLSCSIVSNGFRSIVEPEMYMEGIKKIEIKNEQKDTYYTRYRYDHTIKKTVPYQVKMNYSYKPAIQIKFELTVPDEKRIFNKLWLNQFTYERPTHKYKNWKYGNRNFMFDDDFDMDSWQKWFGNPAAKPSPLNVGPAQSVKPLDFKGNNILDENINPCEKCVFLQHKIEWALNNVEWDEDEDDDYDDDLLFDSDEDEDDDFLIGDYDSINDDELFIFSTEDDDVLCKDDGSAMYDDHIHSIVEEQHTSEDFLNGEGQKSVEEPYDGQPIPDPTVTNPLPMSLTEWLYQRVARMRNRSKSGN